MDKNYYNNFYKKYGANIHTAPVRFSTIAKLCQGSVLDVGCGTGDLADYYEGDYTGFDISDVAINLAKKIRRYSADFLVGDILNPKLKMERNFDTIVLGEILEHLEDDNLLLQNIRKWSKVNTRLVISVPNGDRVKDKDHKRVFTVPKLRRRFKKLGKVQFHNYEGFRERILMSVDFGRENEDLISLPMIVKNEEKGLEKAILSCIDFVDNIVIAVDTKSKDDTLEIAKRYADEVKLYQWKNDFADSRNFAQAGIKTKWCLILDGHEYIKECKNLKQYLKLDFDGLVVKVQLENGFLYWHPRIIRNYVKWVKPVHNYPDLKTYKRYPNFMVRHERRSLKSLEAQKERNIQREKMIYEILTAKVKKNKRDVRSIFYLAQQSHYNKEIKKAIKYYKWYLKYAKDKQERWLVWYELGNCYNVLGRHRWAIHYFKMAEKELPQRWEIAKKIGATFSMMKKWDWALLYLVDSFKENKTDFVFNPEPRNDAQTWFFISQCFFACKKYEEAKIALKRAKKVQGEDEFSKLPEEQKKIIEELT